MECQECGELIESWESWGYDTMDGRGPLCVGCLDDAEVTGGETEVYVEAFDGSHERETSF